MWGTSGIYTCLENDMVSEQMPFSGTWLVSGRLKT